MRQLALRPVIDLHSHILPGLDDGPDTVEGSVALARAAVAAGTTTMVATPHVDDSYSLEPVRIGPAVAELSAQLRSAGVALDLLAGGEVTLARLSELDEDALAAVRIGEGPYVLLETPFTTAGHFDEQAFALSVRGQPIVLAHPERCPLFQHDPRRLSTLVEAGVLVSMSVGSVAGAFGRRVRSFALELLREGLAHNVASDAHDDARRPPDVLGVLARAEPDLGDLSDLTPWLTEAVPNAILTGQELPHRPALVAWGRPKGLLRRMRARAR